MVPCVRQTSRARTVMMRWRRAPVGEDFASMRGRILHNVTLLFAVMATPAVIVSLARAFSIGWRPFMLVHVILLLAAWLLVWRSGRLPYWQQAGGLLLINLLAGMIGYIDLGPAADGKVLLISAVMLAALFLSERWAWRVWLVVLCFVLTLARAVISGWHT